MSDANTVQLEHPLMAGGAPERSAGHTDAGTVRTGVSRTLMAGLTDLPADSSVNGAPAPPPPRPDGAACAGVVFWLFVGGLVLIVAGVVMALIMETTVIIVGVACVGFGFLLMLAGIGYERYRHSERF